MSMLSVDRSLLLAQNTGGTNDRLKYSRVWSHRYSSGLTARFK